jgi:amidophosphoribosyltransferase
VLLVDDSIVRGTTSAQIIELAREAGARKVYFASAAPPVRFPLRVRHRHAGRDELVAAGRTDDEVARQIGADWLIYQDLEDLVAACQHDNAGSPSSIPRASPGEYVTGDVTPEYLAAPGAERSDARQSAQGRELIQPGQRACDCC